MKTETNQTRKHAAKVMTSSKSDEWATPQDLYDALNTLFGFTLDAAAAPGSHKCTKYFTQAEDGLAQDWSDDVVFINPPYSQTDRWVQKAKQEAEKGATVVMLIKAAPGTRYWADHIWKGATEVWFLTGRVSFGSGSGPAPFDSAVVVYMPFWEQKFPTVSAWDWRAQPKDFK